MLQRILLIVLFRSMSICRLLFDFKRKTHAAPLTAYSYESSTKLCSLGTMTGKSPVHGLADGINIFASISQLKSFPKGK